MRSLPSYQFVTKSIIFFVRIGLSCITSTTFVPDEYYQSIEPALVLSHGIGVITWEWTKSFRLRSHVFTAPFAVFFMCLKALEMDNIYMISHGPRLLSSMLSACADLSMFSLAKRTSGSLVAYLVLIVQALSWSLGYCMSRTLVNSTEAALFAIGINLLEYSTAGSVVGFPATEWSTMFGFITNGAIYFLNMRSRNNSSGIQCSTLDKASPDNKNEKGADLLLVSRAIPLEQSGYVAIPVLIATISCYGRPTSFLLWAPTFLVLFCLHKKRFQFLFTQCMPAGAVTLIACLLVDFCIYEGTMPATLSLHSLAEAWGKAKLSLVGLLQGSRAWPCPPWNFFRVNVLMQWANLYGVQPWHWNFTQGLPVMLGLYTPLLLYGMCCTRVPPIVKWLVWISLLYPLGLSLATRHQEIRFLLPCLPGLHLFLAHVLQDLLFTPTERAGKLYAETPINEPPADSSVTTAYENVNADGSLVDKAVVDGKSKPTDGSSQKFSYTLRRNRGCMWGLFIFVGAVHIAAVLFLTLFHQSGTETAMLQLALRLRQQHPADPSMAVVLDTQPRSSPPALNVLLLAPCHAFPGYSFLWGATRGRDFTVQLYYPDCSPNVSRTSESKTFESSPSRFLQAIFDASTDDTCLDSAHISCATDTVVDWDRVIPSWPHWPRPDYVLTFDSYLPEVRPILEEEGFFQVGSFRHAYIRYDYDDPHPKKFVHLFERPSLLRVRQSEELPVFVDTALDWQPS